MAFDKKFGQNLYIARDAKAHADFEVFEIVKELDEGLKETQHFVGTAPFGSKVRGYSERGISDLDVMILIDTDNKEELLEVMIEVQDLCAEIGKKRGLKIAPLFSNVNQQSLVTGLAAEANSNEFIVAASAVADICNAAKGRLIKEHQTVIANHIGTLDAVTIEEILNLGAHYLAERDLKSIDRINERLAMNMDIQEYFEKRKILWQNRMKKVLQLNGEK